MAISTVSFTKTPQAVGDTYILYEDDLLAFDWLDGTIVSLDVISNDLGGAAKVLYSVDDGLNYNQISNPQDLLIADALIGGSSLWEATQTLINGAALAGVNDRLRISNGKVEVDIANSLLALTGTTEIDALAEGEYIRDSFVYAIRLGNGTLSWTTTTLEIRGENDTASITGDDAGTLTEDDTAPATGTLAVTDVDHGQSHTQIATDAASIGGLGTYSVDADGHWSYTVNNALVQYLNANQSTTDTFIVASLDGTAQQTVTVTITGLDDTPCDTFAPAYVVGSGVTILLENLNDDAYFDLITGDRANNLSVAFGNGDGTFATAQTYSVLSPFSVPGLVATGDINGDNSIDIVLANYDNNGSAGLEVLLNNGDGTFAPEVTYATGPGPSGVALDDFNHDGKLDAVVTNQFTNTISILLGNGNGTFGAYTEYTTAAGPAAVEIADVNGDGENDIVVGGNHSNAISVLLGNGSGTFPTHAEYTAFSSGGGPFDLVVQDLNGDFRPDIVTGNQQGGSNEISVLLNNGDGSYAAPMQISVPNPGEIAIAKINSDGIFDLVVGAGTEGVDVMLGNGDGTFGAITTYAPPWAGAVEVADLNGDGLQDVVFTAPGDTVSVLLGNTCTCDFCGFF